MSKAFTKEDDGPEVPVGRQAPRLAPGEKRYITPEGYARMQAELEALPRGDPKHEVLAATLATLTVVAAEEKREGVFFGAWVELEDEGGARSSYRLVGPDEVDIKAGLVSIESPLAKALLGKRVGEQVEVERPRGTLEYTVVSVSYRR